MKIYRCPKTGLRRMQTIVRIKPVIPGTTKPIIRPIPILINARELPDGRLAREVRLLRS